MECYELLPVLQTRRIFIVQLQENCADQQGKGHWQSNLDVHVVTTSGQRILTKGRIAGVEACTGDNVMWHRPVLSTAAGYRSPAVAVIDFFAA